MKGKLCKKLFYGINYFVLKVIVGHIFETSIKCLVSSVLSEILSVCSLRLSGHNLINLEGKYIFSKQILFFKLVLTVDR